MWIREKMTIEINKKMGIINKLRRRIYRHMLLSRFFGWIEIERFIFFHLTSGALYETPPS
jgi:hypothetical protein